MLIKNGVCAVCGQEVSINVDNEPFTDVLNMENYNKFRRINLTRCSCGYCAENILVPVNDRVKALVNSQGYKNCLNDAYMGEDKELPYEDYKEYNIGELEAYSFVCKERGNNIMTARVLGRLADLKRMLAGSYTESKYTHDDELLFATYDKLIDSLNNQSMVHNQDCLNFLRGAKIDSPLCKIFVAEMLSFSYHYDQARQIIDKIKKRYTISNDLSKYIENFLTEVEEI